MRKLIAILCLILAAAAATAEPYPPEVKTAFTTECEKSGGPPATCACVIKKLEATVPLADLAANKVSEETLTNFATTCLTETGDIAKAVPPTPTPTGVGVPPTAAVTVPSNFGPECKRYFQSTNDFCSDASLAPEAKMACPQWKEGLKQMESALGMPGVTQDVINSMEPGCKAGADGVDQARAALKGTTP